MITGEIKAKIDLIWEDFWTGGITNSISVLEQMTYLFFMKLLDDGQQKAESNANLLGAKLVNPTFPLGELWHNPETGQDVPYERLVDHQRLQAVISMPSGVFKPYAGVSTAILIFTKTNSGGTDRVWFYDMRADGFSLDDKRNPVSENDIPDIIHRYEHLDEEETRSRKEQSFFVPAEEIRQNDYDLSINKYKEVERERVEYEPVKDILARLENTEDQIRSSLNTLKSLLQSS